jgi:hypothetical protein
LKNFCRWAVKQNRMPASPLMLMESIATEGDKKRERRALSANEFAKLIKATTLAPEVKRLSGKDRAWLYMVTSTRCA